MSEIRIHRRNKFAQIANSLLQDTSLGFDTRGMLGYLLSKSDDWKGRPSDIEREGNIGRDARRRMMKEAEIAGYLSFHTERKPGGFLDSWYDVHELPLPENERTKSWEFGKRKDLADRPPTGNPHPVNASPPTGLPPTGQPLPGQPPTGQPPGGQPAPHVIHEVQNKDLQNTREREAAAADAVAVAVDSLSLALRRLYGVGDKTGWQTNGQFQSEAIKLHGLHATPEEIEEFWHSRNKKPGITYFTIDFLPWRAGKLTRGNHAGAGDDFIERARASAIKNGRLKHDLRG